MAPWWNKQTNKKWLWLAYKGIVWTIINRNKDGTSLAWEQTNILCMIFKLGRLVPLWPESPSIPPLKGRPALFELPSPGHQTFYRIRALQKQWWWKNVRNLNKNNDNGKISKLKFDLVTVGLIRAAHALLRRFVFSCQCWSWRLQSNKDDSFAKNEYCNVIKIVHLQKMNIAI